MQKNRILAVYPDLNEQLYLQEIFSGSNNEIICTSCVIEAIKLLLADSFSIILVGSKTADCDNIVTTLKTITDVPIIVAEMIVCKKNLSIIGSHQNSNLEKDSEINSRKVLNFGELIVDPDRRLVLLNGADIELTKIEFDILYLLAKHTGRVLSRDQIYNNVWQHNTSYDIDELVKAHIKRLRKKLELSKHDYIQNVRGIGYKFAVKNSYIQ